MNRENRFRNFTAEKLKKAAWFILAAVIVITGFRPMKAQAASKMVRLQSNVNYTGYDVTGDGKADRFRYTQTDGSGYSSFYLNGKYKGKVFMARGGSIFVCNFGRNKVYLVNEIGQYGGDSIAVYRFQSGKLKTVHSYNSSLFNTAVFSFKSVEKVNGNYLYVVSNPRSWHTQSFAQWTSGVIQIRTAYKLNSGKFVLVSRTTTVTGRSSFTALSSFRTSTSVSRINSKGPAVKRGQTVTLMNAYFDKKNNVYYKIKVGSRTGWFKDSNSRQFI